MRKLIPFLITFVMVVLTSGCSLSFGGSDSTGEPTLSDAQMQTEISSLLTAQPTATIESKAPLTATPALPTVELTQPPAEATATPVDASAPLSTDTPMPVENAPEATATVAIQGDAQAGGGGPTPTPPPTLTPASGTQSPTATVSPSDPRSYLGNPTSTDPMDNSTAWLWPTGSSEFTSVSFTNGTMVLTSLKETSGWRLANPAGRPFNSLYLEATIRTGTCKGSDQYGLVVRMPVLKDADQGYLFGFTCDGRYSFRSWDGKVGEKGKMTHLVSWTASKAIYAGSGQTNRIGLMTVGSRMMFYANGTYLGEVNNSTYPSGFFGLFVGGQETSNFAITTDEMSYWENPQPK